MLHAGADALAGFSTSVLLAAGADQPSAEAATWAMLHASLHGVDSHGIRLLPFYAECLSTGLAKGSPTVSTRPLRRAAVRVDADGGLGHLATYRAMDEACALAREGGVGLALVVNSTHFGAAGAYALAAANAGFVGFVASNSGAFVVPHGGKIPLHGTNPIALAAPNPGGDPFLLDMATSSIPWNKVLKYRLEAIELPRFVAVNNSGEFVTDAASATALAPLGGAEYGYKGAGLAGLAEVLGGVLTGMKLSFEQDGRALGDTELGHFVLAIDPTLLMTLEAFGLRLQFYLDVFKSQPGIYAAGGPEWARRREREASGIPLSDALATELRAIGDRHSIASPF
ncbi:MAG: Ldh family oxidoreductase [Alphaproteobacteria bacterium]|nr:Ldh family oxidoreductase [Alphaproteobacteria bacterium]